ncbi:hypothetical protein [Tsukamurella sp. 1534]|uniref:hypothetical protein n=1 Tax=Tsukamurella sp. 1534 TaxID=1151061 RepID=UPI0003057273|nr:hypothetical protein [Tsukamurella sp. 1534]
MHTLTMQSIADLTAVERPVVSMWRKRYAKSDNPFPDPVPGTALFDVAAVAEWLRETGRGNNAEAPDDAVLFSSLLADVSQDLDRASLLLLLHSVSGEPIHGISPIEAMRVVAEVGNERLMSVDDVLDALDDEALLTGIDELAEAAFGAARVLRRMVDDGSSRAPHSDELLTGTGMALLNEIVAEVVRATPDAALVPASDGGLMLVNNVAPRLVEMQRPALGADDELMTTAWQRAVWRSMGAHGFHIAPRNDEAPSILIGQWAAAADDDAEAFFDWIGYVSMSLGPSSRAMIVGPASLLVDPLDGASAKLRAEQLTSGDHYVAPLRYVARLPKGMRSDGSRRRLALWVLGHVPGGDKRWTTYADHSEHGLTPAENAATAADVIAALAPDPLKHAFVRGLPRYSEFVLRKHTLTWSTTDPQVVVDGAALARVWEARDRCSASILDGIDVVGAQAGSGRSPISWNQATKPGRARLARVMKGVRLSDGLCDAHGAGTARVIGVPEVRGRVAAGTRKVDRLILEQVSPRARFTEPGDVVYVPTGSPSAIVDQVGGAVVQAPARIVRILPDADGDARLLPDMVAADIAAQTGSDSGAWHLRSVDARSAEAMRTATRRITVQRDELLEQLSALEALGMELTDGLATGSLTMEVRDE